MQEWPVVRGCHELATRLRLSPKLTKVVIHMEISPSEPGGFRHGAEKRMGSPVDISLPCCNELKKRLESRDVRRKIDRPGTSHVLVNLWARENSGGPWQGSV
jgi:hypothetical protein